MNGYIPDPTNIGTIFVNAISNIMTTAANDVKLNINSNQVKRIIKGDYPNEDDTIGIGSVRFGQTIDILVQLDSEFDVDTFTDLTLTYESNNQKFITKMENPI
mmetsp:Transcript_17426/g.8226  ORF Transcript_17426/g.8226 Transcript_17426/m.8226 type:complete len:103 (+) Transcript_17426:480-788(+)